MTTVMPIAPQYLRKARQALRLTQIQLGAAFGGVRPETISRWERANTGGQLRVRPLHAELLRQLKQAADLLHELYADERDRAQFLNSSHRELGSRTPIETILQDPPYGLRDVVHLLGRMAEGIPA